MQRLFALVGSFVLGSVTLMGGIFTNTGSASETCIWGGDMAPVPPDLSSISQNATGSSINLTCPASFYGPSAGVYIGPTVSGFAGDLSARGISAGFVREMAAFSFQSTFTDLLLPVGGTGHGTVEFTLTYTWGGLEDLGSATDAADFLFSGNRAWSKSDEVCVPSTGCSIYQPLHTVKVIDEPITYGMPFSYAADVSVTGSGNAVDGFNSLTISSAILTGGQLVEVPEPASLWLCGTAFLVLLSRLKAR